MELPNEIKRYYEQKLIESVQREPLFCFEQTQKKKTIKWKMKNWFLERFADLYEKVRDDFD